MLNYASQSRALPKNLLIIIVVALIVIGSVLYYALLGTTVAEEKIIKIGLIAPLIGPLSYGGNDMK